MNKLKNKIKKVKLNPNSFTFFFFLLVSTVFWFFNALNKDYIAVVKVPVNFLNFPENKLVAGKINNYIDVRVAANGYSFLKYKSAGLNEAIINLQLHSIYPITADNDKKFYLLTSTLKDEIANVLDAESEIKGMSPDSIIFDLDEVITKKVPVIKNFETNYRKQFMLKDEISIFPDSIYIKGVVSVLDTVNHVSTFTSVFDDVSDSLKFDIDLEKIQGIDFSTSRVKCIVPVEEFAELSFVLPILVDNQPEDFHLKLFPSEAKVICNVGFSQYRKVFQEQFAFSVDYNDIQNNPDRIKLSLVKFPENVSSLRFYPISVEYLVEEND